MSFFFYVKLLEHSPLESHIDNVSKDLSAIRKRFQGILDDNKNIDFSSKWKNYVPKVKNMAALTFFYCLFVLLVIGFGRYHKLELTKDNITVNVQSVFLMVTSICVLIYNVCCSVVNRGCFRTYVTPIVYALILILCYFSFFKPIENCFINICFWIEEKTNISSITIIITTIAITSIYGMVSVLITIIWDRIKIWSITYRLKDINQLLAAYMAREPYSSLPKNLQKRYRDSAQINGDGTVSMTRSDLMQFIESEVKRRYSKV